MRSVGRMSKMPLPIRHDGQYNLLLQLLNLITICIISWALRVQEQGYLLLSSCSSVACSSSFLCSLSVAFSDASAGFRSRTCAYCCA